MNYTCYSQLSDESFDCGVTCSGLYADVQFEASTDGLEAEEEDVRNRVFGLIDEYKLYKTSFVRNIVFDPKSSNLGNWCYPYNQFHCMLLSRKSH